MGIEKIRLTKCNGELVDKQLEELELDTNGSLKNRVARLAAYYEEHADELDIANCSICGADGDASLDACPFCGDEGEVAEEGAATEGEGEEEPEPEQEDEEDEDTQQEVVEEPAIQQEAQMATAGAATATASTPKGKGAAKAAPKGKGAAKPNGKATAAAKPNGKAAAAPKAPAPNPVSTAVVVYDSSALDEQVQVIRDAVLGGALSLRKLGEAAAKIVSENLWKQRVDAQGVPTFRSFAQFCTQELGSTKVHIYRAMKVFESYSEDDLKGLSGRQARLLLDVPKEQRGEALDAAKRGEAGSKLSDRANTLRGKAGKEKLPEPKKAITVAVTQGHTKIKLFKRPTDSGVKIGETEGATPAKRLADQPWGVLQLSNKVTLMIRVATKPNGELMADVEFRRGEA